jgi:CBS domain-containing protein
VEDVLWLSAVRRAPLEGRDQVELGKVDDCVLRLVEASYPIVVGLLIHLDDQPTFVPMDRVVRFDAGQVVADVDPSELGRFERRPQEVLAVRDLLEHHLIWAKSKLRPRLVSARDLGMIRFEDTWRVIAVDVAQEHHRRFRRAKGEGRIVDWRDLVPLVGHVPSARIRLELRSIRRLHPAELADLLEDASDAEGREIMEALQADPAFEADVVEELTPHGRREAIRERSDEEVGELLGTMEPDDAVDLLLNLDQERRESVLALVPEPQQSTIKRLLAYNPDSAGGLMTTDVVVLGLGMSAAEACSELRRRERLPENLWAVFLADAEGHLAGQLSLAALVRAQGEERVEDLADTNPRSVRPDADLAEVAVLMADFNLAAVAVVDGESTLLGAVTVDDVLPRTIQPSWRRRAEALEG